MNVLEMLPLQKLGSIQYNASLARGCFRRTSQEKIYSELGLESLVDRRFADRMIFFYQLMNDLTPNYLRNYLQVRLPASINVRARNPIYLLNIHTVRFLNSFFPILQRNTLDSHI